MAFKFTLLEELASLHVAKVFWDASFKSEHLDLKELKTDTAGYWEFQLTKCRKEAICNLNNFIGNRKLPSIFKTNIIENIFLLHQTYHQLFLWKNTYDPGNKINMLQEGELYAPNYFTVEGEFNDFSWTKRFVCDPNYNVIDRFSLSCCYWLEKECEDLWLELQRIHGSHIAEHMNVLSYFDDNLGIISLRVLQLQYPLITQQGGILRRCFRKLGFELAIANGLEYTVYYFWEKLSDSEKLFLFQTEKLFELITTGIDYPRDKIIYFLYSQLTENQKYDLVDWTIGRFSFEIWHSLLISPCSKAIRSEIIIFYKLLPTEMYSALLSVLAIRIYKLQFPYDIEIFPVLWNKLLPDEKYYTLKEGPEFIEYLARAKSFDNLSYVIKSFSREQKEKCLFRNLYKAGTKNFNILCDLGEFDMFQKYLSLFLTEINLSTQTEIMNKNASSILLRFIKSSAFLSWQKCKTFKKNKEVILDRIQTLQTCITLLEEICEKVHNEVSIVRTSSTFNVFEIGVLVDLGERLTFFSSSDSQDYFEEA